MADIAYIGLGDETDPDTIFNDAVEYLQGYFPDWEASDSDLATIILRWASQEASVNRSMAAETAIDIFRYYGTLAALPPQDETAATATTTWTMIDDAGYTIDQGTVVQIAGPTGDAVFYQTVEDVTVLGGDTATATGEVVIEAVEPGVAGNDLNGDVELVTILAHVSGIVLEEPTGGGQDPETIIAYITRLATLLQLQAPRPILPDDFATYVRTLVVGVHRATAVDLYDADTDTDDVERCVSVYVIDEDGEPCTTEVKETAAALLLAQREVNFLTPIADPTYTDVDVWFTIVAKSGYDQAEVETAAIAAVEEYLAPAAWGVPDGVGSDTTTWYNSDTVRLYEVASLIDRVDGVDYVDEIWLAESGDTAAATNLTLTGRAPLTRPGTILAEAP